MTTTTTTSKDKFKYVFRVKSNDGDLTTFIRLVEVLGVKQGEYTYNKINNSIEVIRDTKWEEELTNKIKELGFEDILKGKSYSSVNETKYDSISSVYKNLDCLGHLHGKAELKHKLNNIELLTTQVDHVAGTAKCTYKVLPNTKINLVDYAVALAIYNRSYYVLSDNPNHRCMNIDDLINSTGDEAVKEGLKVLKNLFLYS